MFLKSDNQKDLIINVNIRRSHEEFVKVIFCQQLLIKDILSHMYSPLTLYNLEFSQEELKDI